MIPIIVTITLILARHRHNHYDMDMLGFCYELNVILFRVNPRSVVQGKGSKLRLNKLGPSLKFTAPLRNSPTIIIITNILQNPQPKINVDHNNRIWMPDSKLWEGFKKRETGESSFFSSLLLLGCHYITFNYNP